VADVVYGRDLGLAGLPNARDLGGYRTVSGDRIRHGLLFRSDDPVTATDEDLTILGALGIRNVIDLRGDAEIARSGLATWAAPRVHLPIGDVSGAILAATITNNGGETMTAEISERMMTDMYRSFVVDDVYRSQFADAMALIAAPDGLPLLFHCTAGKDRTGWLSAIVLTALGVDEESVVADYLLTNDRFTTGRGATIRERRLMAVRDKIPDIGPILPLLEARPGYLEAAFAGVSEKFGTFDGYLDDMGVDIPSLRANLLA
jgi:protein-tyrosine phosphatase